MVSVDIKRQGMNHGAPVFIDPVSMSMVLIDCTCAGDYHIGLEAAIPRQTVSNSRIPIRYDFVSVELD